MDDHDLFAIHHHSSSYDYSDNSFMSPHHENIILNPPHHDQFAYTYASLIPSADARHRIPAFGSDHDLGFRSCGSVATESTSAAKISGRDGDDDASIRARIASHPCYPKLLDAYIDCQKVGAPPEIARWLDEIRREKESSDQESTVPMRMGMDPELDEFMETYCDVLVKLNSDLSRPYEEATSFLNTIESQLTNLCKDDGGVVSSEEEFSGGEVEIHESQSRDENRELKNELLRRYGSHIGSLKQEFSKKKKKGKLPKEARQVLLQWWDVHCSWPYPTERTRFPCPSRQD